MNSIDSLQYFVPELIIIGTALLAIIYDLTPDSKHNNGTAYIALGGIALTLIAIFSAGLPSEFLISISPDANSVSCYSLSRVPKFKFPASRPRFGAFEV